MSSAFSESQPCRRELSHLAKQFSSSGYSTSLVEPSWIGHRLGFIAQGSLVRILLLSIVSLTLKIESAMQYTYSCTLLIHTPILKPIGDENSEHGLWFLLCSKSSMLCSIPIVIIHLYIYPC